VPLVGQLPPAPHEYRAPRSIRPPFDRESFAEVEPILNRTSSTTPLRLAALCQNWGRGLVIDEELPLLPVRFIYSALVSQRTA